jgi:hypothetical protein
MKEEEGECRRAGRCRVKLVNSDVEGKVEKNEGVEAVLIVRLWEMHGLPWRSASGVVAVRAE